jgi:PKD repeat protein
LLLPDGTVALMGGNPTRGSYEQHIEIYSPAYLFKDGAPASRPTITSTSDTMYYGHGLQVQTPDAGQIQSVVLVRPGSQTHAFDMDQRLVELSFTKASGSLTVTAPPHGNIAPPGYYMLFILNSAGVPSLARFVRLTYGTPANQAPTATIASPASNVTVNPGGSISFTGSGADPDGTVASYAWTFNGGSPAASTEAAPGAVTYSTPGSYSASLTVTDDAGTASVLATRTITVADFSLSAMPASRSVLPAAGTTYTATVDANHWLHRQRQLRRTRPPVWRQCILHARFGGERWLDDARVSTSAATPIGTHTLTINGTSGPITRSATVTLVVAANQAPTASITSPASNVTVNPGGSISFTGSGADPDGTVASYAWSFAGGSPAASTQAAPGAVTYRRRAAIPRRSS